MKYFPLASIALLLAGCGAHHESFSDLAGQFAREALALSPVGATSVGYHEHNGVRLDSQLDDMSARGVERQRQFFTEWNHRLATAASSGELTAEDQADYRLLRDQIGLAMLEANTIQNYRHNPTVYVELAGNALYSPYILEYAPKAERFKHIIARLEKLPTVFDAARQNLVDSPAVWNRVAQEENEGNIGLIDVSIRRDCPPELKKQFDPAAAGAITALREFNNWLKTDLARHTSDWRLGKEKYAQKFRYALETDTTPEQLLADAEAQIKAVRERMAQIAKPDTVEAALDKIAKKHATPQTYIDDAKRDLDEARAFVSEHKLLGLPQGGNLQVIETPVFMRGIYGVGGFSPAPPLEPKLGAYYWITPIPANWPADRIESKLREYNTYGLKILTVHEAMPGHYVQAEYANNVQPANRRLVRSLFGSSAYVEGWAVYATDMMIDQGYYKNDPGMQLTWGKQLLRAIANTVLDIRFQTMGLTEQQALDLMIKDTYQEKEEATAKVQRSQLSSCQLPTYFAGYRAWQKVRQASPLPLAEFHERAMKEGAVALPDLERLLAK